MKEVKFFGVTLLMIFIIFVYFTFFNGNDRKKLEEKIDFKNDWYVEITNDFINVRSYSKASSKWLGEVYSGEKFPVSDVDYESSNTYYWYKIEYEVNKYGWIASDKNDAYLIDYNNPNDIAVPTIKILYFLHAKDINSITFDNLEVWDDKGKPEITYKVYHEKGINKDNEYVDQYWIMYTVTDKSGKFDSKLGSIEFDIAPDESEVSDFKELEW